MPDHLDAIPAGLVVLGGAAALVLIGVCLLLQRIVISTQRRRSSIQAYVKEVRPEDDCWEWEEHSVRSMDEPVSSRSAVRRGAAGPGSRRGHSDRSKSGRRVEYFDMDIDGAEAPTDSLGSATEMSPSGRFAMSAREISRRVRVPAGSLGRVRARIMTGLSRVQGQSVFLAERVARICEAAWDRLRVGARRVVAHLDNPARPEASARPGGSSRNTDPAIVTASRRGRSGLLPRLGIATSCLALALFYTPGSRQAADTNISFSDPLDEAHPDVSGSVEAVTTAAIPERRPPATDRTDLEVRGADPAVVRAQVEAARAEAAAAREIAERERKLAEAERARSATLQEELLASRRRADAEGRADDARVERLRNELAAQRALDAIRGVAGDSVTQLRELATYVAVEMPAARRERQRVAGLARNLSQSRAQAERLAAEATEARASLAEASGFLDTARRESERLRGELAETKRSNGALAARADAAERERAVAAATKDRAEQAAVETERALTAERVAASSVREELEKARRERDTARAASGQIAAKLQEALDAQREVTAALARELAAARQDNDRLSAERSVSLEPVPRPRPRPATADTGEVKPVSQRIARRDTRDVTRVTRLRAITLPYSLRPTRPAVE
jgi:hypothetical protein